MKRFLSALLVFVLTAGFLQAIPVKADTDALQLFAYEVVGGEATITKADPSVSGNITIPSELDGYPVTAIGNDAFFECGSLTGVVIPEGVRTIGEGAFYKCSGLTQIIMAESVNSIGYGAFYKCTSLQEVTIPNGVTFIDEYTFAYCNSLAAIVIPDGITNIGSYAFYECSSLTEIKIPDSVTNIGIGVFYKCINLTYVGISQNISNISNYAFAECTDLENVVIPKSVTAIGEYAFAWCDNLDGIVIPDSVITIGKCAFACCINLKWAVIGNGVRVLGEGVFTDCSGLTEVTVGNSLSVIGNHVFLRCSNLTEITLPTTLINIGSYAFSGCDKLSTVYYCGSEEQWKGVYVFDYNNCLNNAQFVFNYKPLVNGKVEFWRLILQDQIGVYFQMKYTEGIKLDKDAYVEVAVAGEISKVPVHTAVDSLLVNVAAAQMTDEISICVVSGDGIRGETAVYSVKAYADQVLAGNYDNATKNLVASMLSYGAKAQEQFQYRLDAKADSGVNCVRSAVPGTADVPMEVTGEIEGISLYGASVLYDSKLALRYYFETDDISGYTFTVNGKQLQSVGKSGRFYVEIPDILPQNIDKFFTVTVQDAQGNAMSIVYNPLNYVVRMYNKANTSQETKNLLQALYTYHLAAKDYTN